MVRISIPVALVLLPSLMACDQGDEAPARETHCKSFCEKLDMCDDSTDVLGCVNRCQAEDFRSSAYVAARADCVGSLSCTRFVDEVGPQGEDDCDTNCELLDCVGDTVASLELSDDQEGFCSALTSKLYACDSSLDEGEVMKDCGDVLVTLSDEYLTSSRDCVETNHCDEIVDCLGELADRFDTDIKVFDGRLK